MSGVCETCWRIFIDGKFSFTLYACSADDAIRQVNERLGYSHAASVNIKAYRANNASD